MIKYIVLIIVTILFLIWPLVKNRLKKRGEKRLIREALRSTREMNERALTRIIRQRAARIREEQIERGRINNIPHPYIHNPIFKKKENKPAVPAIEFLKKEDFEI